MGAQKETLDDFVAGLSAKHARELVRCLLLAFVMRQKDATEEYRFVGRGAQKRISQILVDVDAPWAIRQYLLNAGRVLYLSTDESHEYYRDELLTLLDRFGDALGDDARTTQVRKAFVEYDRLIRATPDGAEGLGLLRASTNLVQLVSRFVNDTLDAVPDFPLKTSAIRPLGGIVDAATAERVRRVAAGQGGTEELEP